jgi:archaellum component FlaC
MENTKIENLLQDISSQIHNISKDIDIINKRIDKLEDKTNDIHQYVPFVGWLESVGKKISLFSLLNRNSESQLLENKNN